VRPAGPNASSSDAQGTGVQTIFRRAATGAVRRIDTGTLRRIRETGALRMIMDTSAMRSIMDTAAIQALRDKAAGKSKTIATVVLCLWAAMAVVIVWVVIGGHGGGNNATASSKATTGAHPATTPTAVKASRPPVASAAIRVLPIAGIVAWGPNGTRDADNPTQAARAIDASTATAWRSKWYTTADFSGEKPGVALLLDMGKTVTVTGIELKLAPGSADYLIRVGNHEVPGTLTTVASRANSGGTVTITLSKPRRGRYVELWITQLPRESTGTYRESVYTIRVRGRG
jgi:hypothetical protein